LTQAHILLDRCPPLPALYELDLRNIDRSDCPDGHGTGIKHSDKQTALLLHAQTVTGLHATNLIDPRVLTLSDSPKDVPCGGCQNTLARAFGAWIDSMSCQMIYEASYRVSSSKDPNSLGQPYSITCRKGFNTSGRLAYWSTRKHTASSTTAVVNPEKTR